MKRGLAFVTLSMAGMAMLASGCTRTSTYVPPGGFHDPEAAQCRGLSSKVNFDACIIAGRTGRSFAEVRRELIGPDVTPPLEPYYPLGLASPADAPKDEPGRRRKPVKPLAAQ